MPLNLFTTLRSLARTPKLLIACDYDGTLAEIVTDPAEAVPDPHALAALRALARVEDTRTAIVSGRSLRDLNTFLGEGEPVLRFGSHGAEWDTPGVTLSIQQRDLLVRLAGAMTTAVSDTPGLRCELKPAGVALHTRGASRHVARWAVDAAVRSFGTLPDVWIKHGDEVVEFMVVPANKGEAVLRLKEMVGASAMLFLGDDLTDEDAFRALDSGDVGLRVGHGDTHATHTLAGVAEVGPVLETLGSLRGAWIAGRSITS
jgi:trehalose 6-phosphate phosphatase